MVKAQVVIDTRESRSKVPGILEKFLETAYAPLAFGDYQISDEIVFERKSYNDWEGSVIDGRIFRQAKGLRESFKRPVFILEGGPKYGGSRHTRPKITKAQLHGSFLSIGLGFNIPIIPTNNPTETANLIIQAVKRLDKPQRDIGVNTHKKGKTTSEIRQQVFSCFPGVGPKLAKQLDNQDYALIELLKAIDDLEIEGLGPKKKEGIMKILKEVNNE